jgi:hypothetical protein
MKKLLATIVLLIALPVYAGQTASVGNHWKQIDSTLFPADDITRVDLSFVNVTGVAGGGSSGASTSQDIDYFILRDVKASGVGGGVGSSGNWVQRDLTEEKLDTGAFVVLSSNSEFIAKPGNYVCEILAPNYRGGAGQVLLRDVFVGSTTIIGPNAYTAGVGDLPQTNATAFGRFTTTVERVYAIEHRITDLSGGGLGFGVSKNWGSPEVYSTINCEVQSR